MEFNGKKYSVIIWDWLWTLYSPLKGDLYSWVREYFELYGDNTKNYLISFAVNPDRRKELVEKFGMDRYFESISAHKYEDGKLGAFRELIEKEGLNKEEILVVGDNVKEEIHAAMKLGLAYAPIADWSEFVSSKLSSRSE